MWCRFCLCIAVYTQQLRAWTAIVSNMIRQYRTQVQILCDGFDSRLESIAFDIYIRWLLIRTTQARLAVFLQHRWTFNSIVIPVSARLPCFSSWQNALLLLPVLNKASENWNLLKRLLHLIWQTADYLFSFHLLAFLSTYHRKQWGATRAPLGVAGHLSTYRT